MAQAQFATAARLDLSQADKREREGHASRHG